MKAKTVLVVDDSKLLHRVFDLLLRHCKVLHAGDGVEGLERLAQHSDIDVILLDMNMPRMNGLEFLAKVKADPAKSKIPVVVITTEGKESDAERGMRAGAAAYLRKPFRNEEVVACIEGLEA